MVDVSNAPVSDGVMLALLPRDGSWCQQDLPHMTLVYAGVKQDLTPSDFSALAKDASSLAQLTGPFALRVTGIAIFGQDPDRVNVFTLEATTQLLAMRRFVESWNKSQHPFNPHATIGPVGGIVPEQPWAIAFDRLYVGWGGESLTFWLKQPPGY